MAALREEKNDFGEKVTLGRITYGKKELKTMRRERKLFVGTVLNHGGAVMDSRNTY